ncbi:MAG: AhpC/TSA family protein [Bacteroidia bacterium]|nr:AhpC/TSA family protein [Bacteroidia bacterium]
MRKILVFIMLLFFGVTIVYLFWKEEYRYSLPTPVPQNFQPVSLKTVIPVNELFPDRTSVKPVFLHFFNPECPCSRFNLPYFQTLVKTYGHQVNFAVVVPEGISPEKMTRIAESGIAVISDTDKKWAIRCGVYATPQAVIIDPAGKLFYRGNYNKSRFCTLPGSNYASLSLEALLAGRPLPDWDALATTAYGCQIPDSVQQTSTNPFEILMNIRR